MKAAVKVKNLTKSFGKEKVLKRKSVIPLRQEKSTESWDLMAPVKL
mgnify:CR=1 FL=1